jgi:hypothetical protein
MAAVVAIGPTSLTLDLDNPGAVSDPVGVGLVVECNGVESVVGVGGGAGAGAGPDAPGPRVVRHVLSGLAEGTVYSVRYRCVVGEAGLDAGAPWSPVLSVTTSTAVLERILVGGGCMWHGGETFFSLCGSLSESCCAFLHPRVALKPRRDAWRSQRDAWRPRRGVLRPRRQR